MAGFLWLAFMIFPEVFLGLMVPDPKMVEIGVPFFRILFSTFLLTGVINNSATLFQALGKGWKASIIFLSRQVVFFIPLLIFLPDYFGVNGVWLSIPAAEGLTLIIIAVLLVTEFKKLGHQSSPITGRTVIVRT